MPLTKAEMLVAAKCARSYPIHCGGLYIWNDLGSFNREVAAQKLLEAPERAAWG